ncbi:hypothetical protein J8273_6803 [Carpediemonas membranifera]|uniref:Uncharacterized protein n=1 Tax=Carpediemonas membranifera TaxID=201153 RepID=A0A8J6DYB7_9EUKA|nr:hypothetical protein J8273_6803 [Carpediemonas membranifera]|eukprot:KAG9391914.1 hypothetical protein J8273_6803 [Carpediemonas membranifera]
MYSKGTKQGNWYEDRQNGSPFEFHESTTADWRTSYSNDTQITRDSPKPVKRTEEQKERVIQRGLNPVFRQDEAKTDYRTVSMATYTSDSSRIVSEECVSKKVVKEDLPAYLQSCPTHGAGEEKATYYGKASSDVTNASNIEQKLNLPYAHEPSERPPMPVKKPTGFHIWDDEE